MITPLLTPTRLVLALIMSGIVGGVGTNLVAAHHTRAATPTVASAVPPVQSAVVAPDFSTIVSRYGASVVNISVTGTRKVADVSDQGMPFGPDSDDPMFRFFRRFQGPSLGAPEQPMHGQGSGFVVSADGLILTNAHVVHGAQEVIVKLMDQREFHAKVLGSDAKTDVAVLKIDAKGLTPIPVGSAQDLKVGEWVLAIGSPFGFESSATAGVVSAKKRSLPNDGYVPFIQTDVAVNPGNSGGPLFNARGEVVGINSQIFSGTGGYQGLSFAIPIDVANRVKDQIVATGHAQHARLGVAIQEVNQTLADSFRLARPEGALVSSVEPDSPADKAGLKSGDVVLKVDGTRIATSGDLPALVGQSAPGTKVAIELWRSGEPMTVRAVLGDAVERHAQSDAPTGPGGHGRLGLALRPLQPQERREAGIDVGLLVEDAAGPAGAAGVEAGDLLLSVNGTPAVSLDRVRAVVAKADKSVALLIQRGGERIFVPVRVG